MGGGERGAVMHTFKRLGLFVQDFSMFTAHFLATMLSRVVIRLISSERGSGRGSVRTS